MKRRNQLLLIAGVTVGCWATFWVLQQRLTATVTGSVVDAGSSQAVPNAKVVVTTWRRYLISVGNPKSYGTVTDAQGRFQMNVKPGYWIASIDVAASAPGDKYAFQRNATAASVRLEVSAANLTLEERNVEAYKFEKFTGPFDLEVDWLHEQTIR